MPSKQFLLCCFQPSRVDHYTVGIEDEPRNTRPTLRSAYYNDVSTLLKDKIVKAEYKHGNKKVTKFRESNSKLLVVCPQTLTLAKKNWTVKTVKLA